MSDESPELNPLSATDEAWANHLECLSREALLSESDARYVANFYNTTRREGVPADLADALTRIWWQRAVGAPPAK